MKPIRNRRRSIILTGIFGVVLAKLIANFISAQTTKISPNFSNDRLIGSYLERDENHHLMQDAAKIEFQLIPMNADDSSYFIFTYIPFDNSKSISIVFESLTINNVFTSKEDKIYGFDGVLKPVKFLENANLKNLSAITAKIGAKSDFPNGCVLKAYNYNSGPSYGIGWEATKECHAHYTSITLQGNFKWTGLAFHSNLLLRTSKNEIIINHKGRNVYFKKTAKDF